MILADLFGDRLLLFAPPPKRTRLIAGVFKGHVDGIDHASIAAICALIEQQGVARVFFDGSNLGAAARAIKRRYPAVQVITFFHNVETRFFLGALRARRTARAAAVLIANHRAERAAVRASDILLCLSERDSALLMRFHGRRAHAITPMAMADQTPASLPPPAADSAPGFLLFVGGGFYANMAGISWFIRQVAPRVAMETVIIGHAMTGLADMVAGQDRIRLLGSVDDLAPWYRDAHVVIAPIFDGSGMKTKVAEALMFGKRVIGTAEAFSGYDDAIVASGWLCRDADDFVRAIEEAAHRDLPAFDPAMRALYDRHHSYGAARARMAEIMGLPT